MARAQAYGAAFAEYTAGWNSRSSLVIQIESIQGVEAAERLLAYDEVDAAMVGPYDISGSLGIPGQLTHAKVTEACQRVIAACRRAGKGCGTQLVDPDPAGVAAALAVGYTFVVLSSDVFLLWTWGAKMRALIEAHRLAATGGRARRLARGRRVGARP